MQAPTLGFHVRKWMEDHPDATARDCAKVFGWECRMTEVNRAVAYFRSRQGLLNRREAAVASLREQVRAWHDANPRGNAVECADALGRENQLRAIRSYLSTYRCRDRSRPGPAVRVRPPKPFLQDLIEAARAREDRDPSFDADFYITHFCDWAAHRKKPPLDWRMKAYKALTGKEWPS